MNDDKHIDDGLLDLLYGELNPEDAEEVRSRIAACPELQDRWQQLQDARRWLDRLNEPETRPDEAPAHTTAIFTRLLHESNRRRRRAKLLAWTAAAVGFVAVVVIAARLRVERHPSHLVIGWGDPPAGLPATDDRAGQPNTRREHPDSAVDIQKLKQRLVELDELTQLSTRELLAMDDRHAGEADAIRNELAGLRRGLLERLNQMQRQSDLRWKLLVDDRSGSYVGSGE